MIVLAQTVVKIARHVQIEQLVLLVLWVLSFMNQYA